VVIIFTCNHCPYARAYIERIARLVTEYEKRNVGFFAISANDVSKYPEDSFENMIPMGKQLNLDGKYLYDESQQVAKAFSAERTPEVYVFNRHNRLVYHGLIDDNANYKMPQEVRHTYLKDALDAVLAGKEVIEKDTKAIGCTIKWKPEMVSGS
jgi:thiol-disulfide isomerase/thioredoxin